ncbi:AtzH-like domain-containing protein [Mumia sp. DW29H23]|uniref:AtzH-like domain-containing protein n=1 Tax=Mumia sp. DW29H23 TaxID=3421241 RepID=UPI003D685A42
MSEAAAPEAPAPEGLLEAFWAYERALMDDDVAALDGLFEPGPATLRGDAGGVLVGHETIGAFRRVRGGAPARTVEAVHVVEAGPDAAVVVNAFAAASGGRGQQTQLWRRGDDGRWRVAVAHVAAPPSTYDRTVWRVVGDPLVPPTGSGVLDGESVAVKDLFAVRGFGVGAGVPAYLAEQPPAPAHAGALERLLAAGASVRGIARTDQLAYSISGTNDPYGAPVNAVVPGALPGGSSSGTATAVALGVATLGLATDTAGSVRVPASYQGLWGLRTTHGSVDVAGLVPLAPSFDTVGLLTRTPARLRAVAAVARGPEAVDVPAEGGWAVAPALLAVCEPEVAEAFGAWTGSLGERVTEVAVPDVHAVYEAFRVLQAYEAWQSHGDWIDAHPGALVGAAAQRFEVAAWVSPAEALAAAEALSGFRAELEATLGDRTLLLPSASSTAPLVWADPAEIDRVRAATLALGAVAGVLGRPAVSAPLLSLAGGPVGVCLVGPRDSDLALVDRAAALAAVRSA